jgi:hypothetical protein
MSFEEAEAGCCDGSSFAARDCRSSFCMPALAKTFTFAARGKTSNRAVKLIAMRRKSQKFIAPSDWRRRYCRPGTQSHPATQANIQIPFKFGRN